MRVFAASMVKRNVVECIFIGFDALIVLPIRLGDSDSHRETGLASFHFSSLDGFHDAKLNGSK